MSRSTEFIPFARPVLGAEEERGVLEVLRSGWLTTGAKAEELERAFAERAFAEGALPERAGGGAVAVSSATAGLHLVFEALDLPKGSRVAMSPYTFTASAEILRYLDLHPCFVDIDARTRHMSSAALEETLQHQSDIRAVMAIHIAGLPSEMVELTEIAKARDAHVVEDAAHSLPRSGTDGVPHPGSAAAVFSLYATKPVAAGEGGVIVTKRRDLAERTRLMRLHGIDRDVWRRYTDRDAGWMYDVVEAGYKYNLPDLLAAVALAQLDSAAERRDRRREIAGRYTEAFRERDYLSTPSGHQRHDWHLYLLTIDVEELTIGRDEFINLLSEAGVGSSVHYVPLHHFSYYRRQYGLSPEDFPVATRVFERSLSLPIYAGLSNAQVERIIDAVVQIGDGHIRRSRRVAGE
ncbi:MAG: UDP-4-amino-4,6-dideoxy-N-acetyl-beta-L-altrosamine transaminase [Spirochaetes bacterium]|jgi:dTDP-4-amino-4,6-dideoxygalactose transaminase|nr:UDP-4-amino-4,6-dideoxy-N-acetyl-beta-L-altrosamine transaminase [Spirochaetota bacterium]